MQAQVFIQVAAPRQDALSMVTEQVKEEAQQVWRDSRVPSDDLQDRINNLALEPRQDASPGEKRPHFIKLRASPVPLLCGGSGSVEGGEQPQRWPRRLESKALHHAPKSAATTWIPWHQKKGGSLWV